MSQHKLQYRAAKTDDAPKQVALCFSVSLASMFGDQASDCTCASAAVARSNMRRCITVGGLKLPQLSSTVGVRGAATSWWQASLSVGSAVASELSGASAWATIPGSTTLLALLSW